MSAAALHEGKTAGRAGGLFTGHVPYSRYAVYAIYNHNYGWPLVT